MFSILFVIWVLLYFLSTAGRCLGAEVGRGAGEDRAPGAGVCCSPRGPGHPAQETDGSSGDQDEADHHQGWTIEKGKTIFESWMYVSAVFSHMI